jgi:fibronectin-binding autotransporter adhesin
MKLSQHRPVFGSVLQKAAILAGMYLAATAGASAATTTWNTGTGSWTLPANWTNGVPGPSDNASFSGSSAQTSTLDGTTQATGTLTISNTSTTAIQGGSAAGTLDIGAGGIAIASGSGAVTIGGTGANAVSVGLAASQSWSNNSSNALVVSNGVTNAGMGIATLTLAGSTTISGVVSDGANGATALSNSSGTLTLAGANSYSGGTTLSAGKIFLNNNSALGTGTFTINGGSIDTTSTSLVISGNNAIVVNGSFSSGATHSLNLGTGGVTFNNADTVSVNNTLTFGGNVTFNTGSTLTHTGSGNLAFTGGTWSAASTNTLTVSSGDLLFNLANGAVVANNIVNNSSNTGGLQGNEAAGVTNTFSGNISGTDANALFDQAGAGTTIFTGTVGGTGAVIFSAGSGGTIQVGNGTTSGSLAALPTILAGTTLAFDQISGTIISTNISEAGTVAGAENAGVTNTLSGVISDGASKGAFAQTGAGTTILSNANTFSGGSTLSTGTVQLQNAGALGTGTVTLGSAETIQLRSNAATTFTSGPVVGSSSGTTVTFDVNNLTSGTGNTLGFGGITFGSGTSDQINVTGGNSYALSLGAISAPSTSGNVSSVAINATSAPVTITSFTSGNAGSNLLLEGGNSITLNALTQSSTGSLLININGATVTLAGATTMNNTSTSNAESITLTSGTLNLNNAGALGSSATGKQMTLILNGGTLNNTSGGAITETANGPVNINAGFTFTGSSSLSLGDGSTTVTGTDTVNVVANTLTMGLLTDSANAAFSFTKSGSGTLVLSNNTSGTGTGLKTTYGTSFINGAGGTLTLNAISTTSGSSVDFSGNVTTTSTNDNAHILGLNLTYGNGADFATAGSGGVIEAENSRITETALPVTGGSNTGVYYITGSQTQTNATSVGALRITDTTAGQTLNLGSNSLTISPGQGSLLYSGSLGSSDNYTISGTGYVTGGSGSTLAINVFQGTLAITDPLIGNADSGPLVKYGNGTLLLTGSNNYTGSTTIGGGILQIGNGTSGSDSATAFVIEPGATLATDAVNGSSFAAISDGGSVNGLEDSGISNTFGGIISGAGNFTQTGLGTSVFTAANTFTGATSITSGIINYQNATAFGTNSTITVSSGGTSQVQGGITSGTKVLTLSGAGAAGIGALNNLSGNNSYAGAVVLTGATTVSSTAGTLSLSGGVSNGGFLLTLNGAGNIAINSVVSGTGGLTSAGTGTVTLSGATPNSYTGPTVISSGELDLNKTAGVVAIQGLGLKTVATAPDVLVSGGTLKFLANDQLANANDNTGNVTLSMTSGAVNLNGTSQTLYAFQNSGGTFTTGQGGRLTGTGATTTFSGGTNTINSGGVVEDNHFVISGGTNTVQGDMGTGVGGGKLQLDGNGMGIVFSNGANLTLNSDATSAGQISLNAGFGGAFNISTTAASTTASITSSGTAAQAGTINLNGAAVNFNIAAGSVPNQGPDLLVSAVIADGSAASSLIKMGTGTMTLTAANSYTGGTTVSAGRLYMNGGISGTSSGIGTGTVTVNSGGTFAGSGSITNGAGVKINSGGSLASGAAQTGAPNIVGSGMKLVNTNLAVSGTGAGSLSANLTFDLGAGNPTSAGTHTFSNPNTSSTYLTLSGTSVLSFTGTDSISLVDLTGGALTLRMGTPYLLVSALSNSQYSGLVTVSSGGIYSLDGDGYVIGVAANGYTGGNTINSSDYTALAINEYAADGMTPLSTANYYASPQLYLYEGELEVVPEPQTWALLLGGLVGLVFWQRRKKSE